MRLTAECHAQQDPLAVTHGCPILGVTQTNTLLGEQTTLLRSALQASVRQCTESYRRYAALENTAWDYHHAFYLIQFLFVKNAAEDFTFSMYFFIIIVTGKLPEMPCSILAGKGGTLYFENTVLLVWL